MKGHYIHLCQACSNLLQPALVAQFFFSNKQLQIPCQLDHHFLEKMDCAKNKVETGHLPMVRTDVSETANAAM